jgi:plasmid stabilization system protein ParE
VSAPYLLTAEAQAHIDEIGAYIAQDNVDAALKVYDAFEEAFVISYAIPHPGRLFRGLSRGLSPRAGCLFPTAAD